MLLLPKPDPAAHALDVLLISEAPAQRLDDCLTHLLPALAAYDGPVTLRLLVQGQPPGGLAGLEAAGDATHAFRVCITRVPSWIGRPAAYNWLLTESTAPWVACLTDEIRVPADAFNRLLSTLQRQPEALAAGGPMLPIPAGVHRVIYPGDGLVLYRRAAFQVAPQFDIRYTPGSLERLDHAVALGMAGHAVLMDSRVTCAALGGPRRSPERFEAEMRSGHMKFFGKWGDDILSEMELRILVELPAAARTAGLTVPMMAPPPAADAGTAATEQAIGAGLAATTQQSAARPPLEEAA